MKYLTSNNYRRSPLVQDGLGIACDLTVELPSTVLNFRLATRYETLFNGLYAEPVNEIIMGSIEREVVPRPIAEANKSAKRKNATHHGNLPKTRTVKPVDIYVGFYSLVIKMCKMY